MRWATSGTIDKKHTRTEQMRMEQGYFHEMMELQKTNGKPFVAEAQITKAADATSFPAVTAETLGGPVAEMALPASLQNKVSLVAVSFKQFGFVQLDSWIQPFLEVVTAASAADDASGKGLKQQRKKRAGRGRGGNGSTQIVQLSALEGGFIANLLKGSMKGGLLKAIPPERHATALVFVGDVDPLCEGLAISNRLIGHAFLVDANGKIRWRACGAATEEEVRRLGTCVAELLAE